MSISKIVLSTVVATGLMFASAHAFANQPAQIRDIDVHKMAMKIKKDLTLSEEQTAKVESILKDMHDEAMKLRDELNALKDKTDQKIKAELTDEQAKKWDEMQNQRQEKRLNIKQR